MTTAVHRDEGGGLDRRLRGLAESDGDDAWANFLKAEGGFLHAVARDHVAGEHLLEDVVQEAVIRIRSALAGYRSYSDAEARGWLRSVVRHVALDVAAAERSRLKREQLTADGSVASHGPCPSPVADPIVAERMESSLRELPEAQLRVIDLHYFEGMSFTDIARRLRLTRHHVHVLHGRALGQLRQRLVSAGAPALSLAALVTLLEARAAAGATVGAGTLSGAAPAVGIAKPGLLAALGWPGAGLIAVGVTLAAGWYFIDVRTPPPALPPPGAASTVIATPIEDFVRRFQEAHPSWRLTDGGRRLGDRDLWEAVGPWTVAEDQAQARIIVGAPGDLLKSVNLTLRRGGDPAQTARLMVGTLTITTHTQRTDFRVGIIADPRRPSRWKGFEWDNVLSLNEAAHDPAHSPPPTVRRYRLGFAVDAERVHLLVDDDVQTRPLMPRTEVCFALTLSSPPRPEAQSVTLDDVQVYEAETSAAR